MLIKSYCERWNVHCVTSVVLGSYTTCILLGSATSNVLPGELQLLLQPKFASHMVDKLFSLPVYNKNAFAQYANNPQPPPPPPLVGRTSFLCKGVVGGGRGHIFKSFLRVKRFKTFMYNDLGFKGNLIAVSSREWWRDYWKGEVGWKMFCTSLLLVWMSKFKILIFNI